MEKKAKIYKSLTPRDPEFQSYLMGDFSDSERAIPMPGLNLQTINDVVTFEVGPKELVENAHPLRKLLALLKPETWLTVLVPLLVVHHLNPETSWMVTLWLGLVLLLALTFANWKSDLSDHLEGWDRLQGSQSTLVLQKGWFTGVQLQKWGRGVLAAAVILGVPLMAKYPWVLAPYLVLALVLLILIPRWWRRSTLPGLASFLIFLLTGPLLTTGIDLTLNGHLNTDSLLVGVMWGLWMSFVRQQRIYTKQWYLYQRKPSASFIGLGFDRTKALMRLMIPGIPMLMVLVSLFLKGGAAWFFPLVVVHLVFISLELQVNEKIQSSIGSHLNILQKLFYWHHWATALVLLLGSILWITVV